MSDAWTAAAEAFESFLLGADVSATSGGGAGEGGGPDAGGGEQRQRGLASDGSEVGRLRGGSSTGSVSGGRRGSSAAQEAVSALPRENGAAAGGAGPSQQQEQQQQQQSAPLDVAQARADAELEAAVLDALTDVVLTQCGPAPRLLKMRLVECVDRGIARPRALAIPQPPGPAPAGAFSHLCVRKMYVLCSRAGGAHDTSEDCLLEVARLALPLFVARCEAMLLVGGGVRLGEGEGGAALPAPRRGGGGGASALPACAAHTPPPEAGIHGGAAAGSRPHCRPHCHRHCRVCGSPGQGRAALPPLRAAHSAEPACPALTPSRPRHSSAGVPRPRLDELMCVLEALASMVLAPQVVDAALPRSEALAATLAGLRARPEAAARGRERSHLLLLYAPLCGLITCREARLREMVKDVLQVGADPRRRRRPGCECGCGRWRR